MEFTWTASVWVSCAANSAQTLVSDCICAGGRSQAEGWKLPHHSWDCRWWVFNQFYTNDQVLVLFAALKFSIVCICVRSTAKVHFQHSAELLSRLVKVEANYSLQLYPDEGHVLRGPRSIQHFQRTVVNYFQNCLKQSLFLEPVEDDEEEDDWAQGPLHFLEGLSLNCMPSSASPWIRLSGTQTQQWEASTSNHPLKVLELLYAFPCCRRSFPLLSWMLESLFTGFSSDDVDQKSADSAKGLQRFLKLIAWQSWGYNDYFWGLKVHLSDLILHNVKKAAQNEATDV